jgi:hypothetical protein
MDKFSPYLNHATYAVVIANLSYPLGTFNLEKELMRLSQTASEAALEAQENAAPLTKAPRLASPSDSVNDTERLRAVGQSALSQASITTA